MDRRAQERKTTVKESLRISLANIVVTTTALQHGLSQTNEFRGNIPFVGDESMIHVADAILGREREDVKKNVMKHRGTDMIVRDRKHENILALQTSTPEPSSGRVREITTDKLSPIIKPNLMNLEARAATDDLVSDSGHPLLSEETPHHPKPGTSAVVTMMEEDIYPPPLGRALAKRINPSPINEGSQDPPPHEGLYNTLILEWLRA